MPRTALLCATALLTLAAPAHAQPVSTDYASAPAGSYTLDPAHTSVTMKVFHLGLSAYTLRFDGVQGRLEFDPTHPEASRVQVTIDPNAVDTGDAAFNRQIADQVFETARFPQIRFVSTAIKPGPEGRGTMTGDLTFHGVTKPVVLDVVFNGFANIPSHGLRMGFSANATVQRSAFGATKYAPMVGDDVSLAIEAEFLKAP